MEDIQGVFSLKMLAELSGAMLRRQPEQPQFTCGVSDGEGVKTDAAEQSVRPEQTLSKAKPSILIKRSRE
jgi:hypothetical protein